VSADGLGEGFAVVEVAFDKMKETGFGFFFKLLLGFGGVTGVDGGLNAGCDEAFDNGGSYVACASYKLDFILAHVFGCY